MMPASGQPNFVVVDDGMLLRGMEGVRAIGFFDAWWDVTRSSLLSSVIRRYCPPIVSPLRLHDSAGSELINCKGTSCLPCG